LLEHLRASRDDKGNRFDVAVVDSLESAEDLVFVQIDTTLGHEGDTSLRVGRSVLSEVLELVVLVFVVSDVAVTAEVSMEAFKES
jgi:hypothetical protein